MQIDFPWAPSCSNTLANALGGGPPSPPDYKLSAPWVAWGLENFPKYKWGVGGRLQNFSTYKLPPKNQPGQNFKVQIHVSEATQCKNNCVFLRGEGVGGQQAHTAIKTWALKHTVGENSACRLLGHILESTNKSKNKTIWNQYFTGP